MNARPPIPANDLRRHGRSQVREDVLIYVEEDLRGEGVALLLRKPSSEGGGSWHGAIVVRVSMERNS